MNEQVRRRRIERHCAATIRAISAHSQAEYRQQQLFLQGRAVRLHVPHLAFDILADSIERCRGVADALALRLTHSDRQWHHRLMPSEAIAGLVFDILEQLRTESLVSEPLRGIKSNLDRSFDHWCRQCQDNGLIENELGLLIYSVTQLVRARFNNRALGEEVETSIESVRFRLAPIIGHDLALLGKLRGDQAKFAKPALRLAETIGRIAGLMGSELIHRHLAALRSQNLLPPAAQQDDRYVRAEAAGGARIDQENNPARDYHVYCGDFDKQVMASALYRQQQRHALRIKLDQMIAAQAISIPGLARRLQQLFAIKQYAGWRDGEEQGYIDGRRLSQIVSRPGYRRIFKQQKQAPCCDTALTFLIDNSGSMKRQRFEAVTILVDIFCRALELAGVTTEILGFTTRGWAGGESIKAWRSAGSPDWPGRLNDRLHIVYKDSTSSWRRSRNAISSLMNPTHFREGLDGEALQWASQRLRSRVESRKCLVMISDGAPMDSATCNYNSPYFLERHLQNVVNSIERAGDIELKAIGIGLDMEAFFSQAITLDLTGTLTNRAFKALELLFSPGSSGRRTDR